MRTAALGVRGGPPRRGKFMAGGEREGDKGLEVGERWRWVSHCHPPPPSPLTFPPVLAPSPQWGWGRGWGLVRCPAGPPSPSAAQKAPLPPFGPRRSPAALRGGCSPCPDPHELLLLWGDPTRGCRRGMPVFGSPQPPALGSRRQQLRATRTHPTFSQELPPQAGNRAPLSGGDRAGGPGAPVPAHKEPLERAGTPWLKALRILQRPFDSGFVTELPEDCQQLFLAGQQSSGIFQVQPSGSQPFKVYCDMTAEGGWTVIQRRTDGSVDFDQLWDAYKNGFGDLHGDFWLGLEKIHHLVQEGRYNLLIELEDWEGNSQAVQFEFSLGGESTAYTLNLLGPLSGELENAIGDFRQLPFSTRDRDHDLKADTNCAKHLSGGWWFSTCGHANLNGKYFRSIPRQRHERKQGIFWKTWKGRYYPLKSTTMKIQPTALEAEP
ncbi:angiopoietin-related protein 4 isoform X2 [Anas acuta]|uniref:angiopoietin-related protein 4 isoform X2 n=1 Tax=Anas acuta TaxID=28680 RepID=UPI0035C91DE3